MKWRTGTGGVSPTPLRRRLRELLQERINLERSVELHAGRLDAIAVEVPHTIRTRPAPRGEPLSEFNCVMHALGLVGRIENPYGRPFNRWYADTVFLLGLIDSGLLRSCNRRPGGLVTWSSREGLKHVGVLLTTDRATSKWGVGHLYEHGLLEVPTSYGDRLAFYEPLASDDALEHLKRHYGHPGSSARG